MTMGVFDFKSINGGPALDEPIGATVIPPVSM
jgi:hypothetical protein